MDSISVPHPSVCGCPGTGPFRFVFFTRVIGRLGPGNVVLARASVTVYVMIYSIFPFENLAPRHDVRDSGTNTTVRLLVMLIPAATPNSFETLAQCYEGSRTDNGRDRTVGPAAATSVLVYVWPHSFRRTRGSTAIVGKTCGDVYCISARRS
jgi:hypothetical protein